MCCFCLCLLLCLHFWHRWAGLHWACGTPVLHQTHSSEAFLCLVSEHCPCRSACVPAHLWRSSLLGWSFGLHPSVPPLGLSVPVWLITSRLCVSISISSTMSFCFYKDFTDRQLSQAHVFNESHVHYCCCVGSAGALLSFIPDSVNSATRCDSTRSLTQGSLWWTLCKSSKCDTYLWKTRRGSKLPQPWVHFLLSVVCQRSVTVWEQRLFGVCMYSSVCVCGGDPFLLFGFNSVWVCRCFILIIVFHFILLLIFLIILLFSTLVNSCCF